MPRVEIGDVGERDQLDQPVGGLRCFAGDRLQQVTDVVSNVDARQYPADEPGDGVIENRQAGGAGMPAAAAELVDIVAGLTPEQLSKLAVSIDNTCTAR